MKRNQLAGMCFLLLALTACGNPGGTLNLTVDSNGSTSEASSGTGGGSTPASKDLFSVWTSSDSSYELDLTAASFNNSSTASVKIITGQSCSCNVLIQGSESSGNMTISSCTGNFSYNGETCSSFAGSGTYTKSATDLHLCLSSNSCTDLN